MEKIKILNESCIEENNKNLEKKELDLVIVEYESLISLFKLIKCKDFNTLIKWNSPRNVSTEIEINGTCCKCNQLFKWCNGKTIINGRSSINSKILTGTFLSKISLYYLNQFLKNCKLGDISRNVISS